MSSYDRDLFVLCSEYWSRDSSRRLFLSQQPPINECRNEFIVSEGDVRVSLAGTVKQSLCTRTRNYMSLSIALIGVGNEYRSDDGVGLVALRELRNMGFPNTRYIESDGDGADLVEAWTNAEMVILIDAISSGAAPGTIYRFDALTQPLPLTFSSQSTHAFGVAEAIELARILHQLPSHLIVYAIEGKHFAVGLGLSSEVKQAIHEVVSQVAGEVRGSPPSFHS